MNTLIPLRDILRTALVLCITIAAGCTGSNMPPAGTDCGTFAVACEIDLPEPPPTTVCSAFAAGCATDQGPQAPVSVAVGDFDSDGLLDAALANNDSNSIVVLIGNGDGTFQPSIRFPAGSAIFGPDGIVAGDFDLDGDIDLAVATGEPDGELSILTNGGSGRFETTGRFDSDSSIPRFVTAGDVDADGDLDVVVVNGVCDGVVILLNLGDGTFADPRRLFDVPCGRSATIADLNEDGLLDIAVASSSGGNDESDFVSVYIHVSGGLFAVGEHFDGGDSPNDLAAADVDGDGDNDLLVATGSPDYGLMVLLNDGLASFALGGFTEIVIAPDAIIAGDWNGDGAIDVATANSLNDSVSVLLNHGDGTFAEQRVIAVGGEMAVAIASGDFDGDGDLDLVTANQDTNNGSLLLNDGDGQFTLAR